MLRPFGFFFIFIAIMCAVLLFQTSQSVQTLEDELRDITQQNQKEKDEIRVLVTEWDYLNSPKRLESLIEGEELKPVMNFSNQIDQIPEPINIVIPGHKPTLIKYKEDE